MGKFFGSIAFFLLAVLFVYLLNLPTADTFAQNYLAYDSFEAVHVIAAFELLHHPFELIWVIPSWFIAAFIGGLISRSWKGAIVISLITGFVLSLTWLFFMWRYLPNYYNNFVSTRSSLIFLGQTLGTGLFLGFISIGACVLGAYLTSPHKQAIEESPIKEIKSVCPNCGTEFQSKPKFCYKCNTLLDVTEKIKPE